MTDFNEAAESFRTAQLLKLTKELQQEKALHCATHALAVDRSERIIELARIANELKDERDKLFADSRRLAFMMRSGAFVDRSRNGLGYWITFPDGRVQDSFYDAPFLAIDAAMEAENV